MELQSLKSNKEPAFEFATCPEYAGLSTLTCITLELFRLPIRRMGIKKAKQATNQNRSLKRSGGTIAGGHEVFMLDCISHHAMVGVCFGGTKGRLGLLCK